MVAPREQTVSFSGTRLELALVLLRGYLLMIPTIGLYRFWLTSWKRRFYWGHTEIGGDTLEYTGQARQLLLGFLMGVAIFVPIYGLFFYLSTQTTETALTGYGAVAVGVWFLHGYAVYRARDFRLSRTLWRGIRFDQTGSAWGYAFRRFFWSLLNIATLGLAYPFMSANLWAYRYRHSWFGDRAFAFSGSWKTLLYRYFWAWLICALALVRTANIVLANDFFADGRMLSSGEVLQLVIAALAILLSVIFYRAAEMSRMFSCVTLGAAQLTVRLTGWQMLGQYLLFAVALVLAYLLLAFGGSVVLSSVARKAMAGGSIDLDILLRSMQSSTTVLLAIIFGYLLVLAAFAMTNELVLGLGFWRLVAHGAVITGLDTLDDVKARPEDRSLAGEGLADALNVGGY